MTTGLAEEWEVEDFSGPLNEEPTGDCAETMLAYLTARGLFRAVHCVARYCGVEWECPEPTEATGARAEAQGEGDAGTTQLVLPGCEGARGEPCRVFGEAPSWG